MEVNSVYLKTYLNLDLLPLDRSESRRAASVDFRLSTKRESLFFAVVEDVLTDSGDMLRSADRKLSFEGRRDDGEEL